MKKKLSEYGWLEQMSLQRQGITVDGIEYIPPHKKHHSCDGCWFLKGSDEGYTCAVGCDLTVKKSGYGWKPGGRCLSCKDATSRGPKRRDKLKEEIEKRCKEEDEAEELYMDMEKNKFFGGDK